MSDVIFSGSKNRNALNVATVSLTFDNSDNYINIPYNEITVKRRVYRTGENEYFINNEKCRLKDITDLFLDSGIGKSSFNIISQGEVQKIVSESSYDRRVIFESAAEVLKYKKRKEDALKKLDKTHTNLERVNDIIAELEIQVEPLKEQSIKAEEYLKIKNELKNIEVALLSSEITTINEEYQLTKEKIEKLNNEFILKDELKNALYEVYDIERLAGKVINGSLNAKDLLQLKNSIKVLPTIKDISSKLGFNYCLNTHEKLYNLLDSAIVDDPPISIKEGYMIKSGYNEELDNLRDIRSGGKDFVAAFETKVKEETGIKNLKVGFNKVFGYYLEVTKSNLSLVPDRYIRKQTLTNCERYITEELKELENQILGAEDKVINLEYEAFTEIRQEIAKNVKRLQKSAMIIATLDVLASFATVAEDMNYCMPIVDNGGKIEIKEGRHPVIEKMLPTGSFIDNDTYMDNDDNRLSIITGPNMAGKSTYMRQVALITLMAQIGSFVPATEAHIGVVDKIFTRVGASDDLSMGQSTFMVEMMEVADILKEATKNSLVILDEIGRGTSTYDGLSIAWAVAEYISDKTKCGAKTLFATHYHELIELEDKLEGVKNYSIAVKEKGEDVIFLRKIVRGGTDESYGVHVARLAGVPKEVLKRANEILRSLERKSMLTGQKKQENKKQPEGQLDFYNYKLAEIAHEIDKINLNETTPIDALNTLIKIKEKMQ